MADGQVEYKVVINDSNIEQDLDNTNKKVESKTGKFSETAGKVGVAAGKVALAVGVAAVAASGAAIKFGSSFEDAMAASSTLFGDANVNIDDLNAKMLDLSDTSGVAADQLGSSLYNALSAGIPATDDMSEAMSFLEKSTKMAKAGFTDVDTAMSATVKTLNAYGMSVDETDRVQKILMQTQNLGIVTVDELGAVLSQVTPTASAMSVSFEQVGAGLAVMTANGTPAAQATTQLNGLFAELGKSGTVASDNLTKAAEGTQYAGKSFQDLMAEGVPLNDVLNMMGTYAEDNGLGMLDMFSSIDAGKAALSVSGQNSEKFTDALSAMGTETDVVSDAFDKISDTSSAKFDKIMNQLKNTAIDLFLQMEPLISQALPVLKNLFDQLLPPVMQMTQAVMPVLVSLFESLIPPISQLIEAALPVLVNLFETLLPPIVKLIQELMPVLLELFNALLPILSMAIELLGPILDLFLAMVGPIMNLISSALVPLIDVILRFINFAIAPMKKELGVMREVWGYIFQSISDFVSGQVQHWIDIFNNIIDFVKNVFTGNWRGAWQNIKNIFSDIVSGLGSAIKYPINAIIDAINGFTSGLAKVKIPDWVPVVGGKGINIPKIPRLKVGMDYVPSDYFPAFLDRGEAVLTAGEATVYRSLGGDLTRLASQPAAAYSGANNISVQAPDIYLDGRLISRNTTQHQYVDAVTRRYK